MAAFKIVIGDHKTGKSYQKEISEDNINPFLGLKIRSTFNGEIMDMPGYEFEITGGSDYAGFPMRRDVEGISRKKIFTTDSVGVHIKGKGMKKRKTVAGNTIFEKTAQINVKILKFGNEPLEKPAEEPTAESAEKKKEE